MPKLALAVLLVALATLSTTLTYAGFLVVGVVSDYLGIGRVAAGMLLGVIFARLPWIRQGKLRTVGLLPKAARLPSILALLALCMVSMVRQGALLPILVIGFVATFVLVMPWLRRKLFARIMGTLFGSASRRPGRDNADPMVIDAEFREKKD